MGAEKKVWEDMEGALAAAERGCGGDGALAIPTSLISIDISLPLPQMKLPVIDLCRDLFKKWSSLNDSHSQWTRFLGESPISKRVPFASAVLKVTVKEDEKDTLLTAIGYLSAAGFGAKLLGVFGNGIVQSFIDARTLSPSDMSKPKLATKIARQLHKFHEVDVPGSREPQLWSDMFKFLERASRLQFDDSEKQAKYETISFKEIHGTITELKDLTDLLNAPVVFAHNDLLSGNLMLNEYEDKLYFIDFEYGSYSYRGYDIANHFNEYAGFECDYSLYPDKGAQYHFFRNYLSDDPEEVPDNDLEALYVETNTFMLASHLYWALWALIQAKVSPIDFDYLEYFFLRYNEYKKRKDWCFSLARTHISGSTTG
ncbi:hypothetical protein QJS10_CPB22g01152 [Acorus calamus]|uniref:ethanolamine kinase n=1 Tax=Acorus calamus TaxID=4465 RepID=A0AAV9C1V7_ACOCL|nr:hypothetical protein QJS10_CPB22g01152 [Acorus calamus]